MSVWSNIFNLDTLKRPHAVPTGLLGAAALLLLAEGAARVAVAAKWVAPDSSLRQLMLDRIEAINEQRPATWLLGNSTLDWGIDQREFERITGGPTVKLSHGSATIRASAQLLSLYLARTTAKPARVVLLVTKDDFNGHGSRDEASALYYQLGAERRLPDGEWLMLRGARTDLRHKLLPPVFPSAAPQPVKNFDGKRIDLNNDYQSNLVRDYDLRTDWLGEVQRVCAERGIALTVVLLPVTDRNIEFHDRKIAAPKYADVRAGIAAFCTDNGIRFLDRGDPSHDYARYRDSYHLNPAGATTFTRTLAADLARPATTAPTIGATLPAPNAPPARSDPHVAP